MIGLARLTAALPSTCKIEKGEGAGLRLVLLEGDRAIAFGTYEAAVQRALVEHLSPGDIFYDIGANLGFFSLIAAKRLGPSGRVFAFEPVARNAAAIQRSARLNGIATLEVVRTAVGAVAGPAELNLARHIGGAVLASVGAPPDARGVATVDVVRLDEFIAERGLPRPSLVKIDVEGAELDVLRGMARTLRVDRPSLIVELDDASAEGLENKAGALSGELAGVGYELSRLPPSYSDAGWHVAHFVAQPGGGR